MKTLLSFVLLAIGLMFSVESFAQKGKAEKQILGCWKLTAFEISPAPPNMADIEKQVLNNLICFEKDGKYVGKKADGTPTGSGTYNFSEDGKTIYQKTEGIPDDQNPPGKVVKLTDTELVISAMEATMHFTKS